MSEKPPILLKISGEALSGEGKFGIDKESIGYAAEEIASVAGTHHPVVIVGGGNYVRGTLLKRDVFNADVVEADQMGMLATICNGLALQVMLEKIGIPTRVLSAFEVRTVCEMYIRKRALKHMRENRVVICTAGTGNPDCSTDSAMTLRAYELGIKILLKGTKVDGVYSADPKTDTEACFLPKISYAELLTRKLGVIDPTAVTQAMKHKMEIRVFDFFREGNLRRVLMDGDIGSVICA